MSSQSWEEKIAEGKLENQRFKLEKMGELLNLIPDGVIATDKEGKVTLINSVAENLTGWSPDEAMGQPLAEVLQLFDIKTQQALDISSNSVESNQNVARSPHLAVIYTASGIELIILFKKIPLRDSSSNIFGAVIIMQDVTELKKLEEKIIDHGQLGLLGDVVLSRTQVEFPQDCWNSAVSRAFPDVTFKIESIIPGSIFYDPSNKIISCVNSTLVYFKSPQWESIVQLIENYPSVLNAQKWETRENANLLNLKSKDHFILRALLQSECIIKYPVIFQNGIGTWEVLSPRKQLDYLLSMLDEYKIQYKLQSIEPFSEENNRVVLTTRQEKVREMALELGYYDIPRRITLTELAKKLKIATSTLSGILRRISRTLVTNE